MSNNNYTPKSIADLGGQMKFSIPLYQRLFEWGEVQVEKLLNDLRSHYNHYKKDQDSSLIPPYYIGMLTAHKNKGKYDLVDGQQRFTVMTLLGLFFNWKEFVLVGDSELRLTFYARPNDEKYLLDKVKGGDIEYENIKMKKAIDCIKQYVDNHPDDFTKEEFGDFIYQNLAFFISELPEKYNVDDLNRYFETMNSCGKALENYEILKVELLKQSTSNKILQTKIWNVVEQMDSLLIKQKEGEETQKYRERYLNLILQAKNYKGAAIEGMIDLSFDEEKKYTIRNIEPVKNKPNNNSHEVEGIRSIINFQEFLLLVLDIQLGEKGSYEFHRTDKLLETFRKIDNIDVFFENMYIYRLLFDYYIVRIQTEQSRNSYDFEYRLSDENGEDKDRTCLIKLQSMLYVSTSHYNWLRDVLIWLNKETEIKTKDFLDELKKIDNTEHLFTDDLKLNYGKINRYWFWRLDYHLWESEYLKEGYRDPVILNYSFRSNRSIEHLHPQDEANNEIWDKDIIDSFGNLAMISQEFNSKQLNRPVNVKFAYISNQIERGELQSIKMYKMYKMANELDSNWTIEMVRTHEKEMIDVLKNSYDRLKPVEE